MCGERKRSVLLCFFIRAGLSYVWAALFLRARYARLDLLHARHAVRRLAALRDLALAARAALLDLADSCSLGPPQCAHPLAGRIMTNGYSCGPLTATNAVPDAASLARGAQAEAARWHATYATLPRANPACAPNAHYSWNRARWCGQLYAARDIAAGEEVTSKYVVGLTRAERRAQMERVYSYSVLTLWEIQRTMAESMRATFCETLA